jgi:hypothetical protein
MKVWTEDGTWNWTGIDFNIEPIKNEHYPAGISFEGIDADRIPILYCPNCGQKIELE